MKNCSLIIGMLFILFCQRVYTQTLAKKDYTLIDLTFKKNFTTLDAMSNGYVLIKGKTVMSRNSPEGMPGVQIYFPVEQTHTSANVDGEFSIYVQQKDSYEILFFYDATPIIHLVNVTPAGKDTLDLGQIVMIQNKMISTAQLKAVANKEKPTIKPIYCYSDLLGFFLSDEVEETDLLSVCKDPHGKEYRYPYDSKKNIITIDYQKIKECQ